MAKKNRYLLQHDEPIEALSYSQMAQFLRCRKAWEYRYRQGLNPISEARPLRVGKLAHEAMAAYWNARAEVGNRPVDPQVGVDAIRRAVAGAVPVLENEDGSVDLVEIEALEEATKTASTIYLRALDAFQPENWEVEFLDGVPMVEVRFAIPAARGVPIQGFIDLVARDRVRGGVWQIDWKFVSTLSDAQDEMFNIQNVIYQRAASLMGCPAVGSITFKTLNKPGTEPRVNKDGSLSRAQIRCTWGDYAARVLELGQDPEDYRAEMEPKLSSIEWTSEVREYWSKDNLQRLWKDEIVPTAREVLRKDLRYPRYISAMTCRSCPYQSICHGELRGYDVEGIRAAEYTTREERRGPEEEPEEGTSTD